MNLPKKFLCALGMTALLVACKSAPEKAIERIIEDESGDDADVEMNLDGTVDIETDDGTFTSGKDIPTDWPTDVEVYDEAEVQYSASVNPTTGEPGKVLIMTSEESVEDVAAFYRESLTDAGWEIEGDMRMGTMFILGGKKDDRVVSVMLTEAEGKTGITLAVGEEK